MNKEFSRVRSARDIVLSSVLLLAGLACILVPSSMAISILGCFITIIGIVLFCVLKSLRKDKETGTRRSSGTALHLQGSGGHLRPIVLRNLRI